MSRRRLAKLEDSLYPTQAVLHWLDEALAFDSLPGYVESLEGQPESAQPFVALPAQVEKAIYEALRGERTAFIKEDMRRGVADTVFLLGLVLRLNVHIEETLRTE